MKRILVRSGAVLCLAAVTGSAIGMLPAQDNRVFELRIYTTHEGKLEELHRRFRDHTNAFFRKHGMTLIGYWTPADPPESANTLIYVLAFPSRQKREEAWEAFRNDPDWQKAYQESTKDGRLVKSIESKLMDPTDYSPIR